MNKKILAIIAIIAICIVITVFLQDPPRKMLKKREPFTLKPFNENKTFRKFVVVNTIMYFGMSLGWPIFPYVREAYATPKQNTWNVGK